MFPFSAIIGQEDAKLALKILAVEPSIGGLLLTGIKGAGKSTLIRSFPNILPELEIVENCKYNCQPTDKLLCPECTEKSNLPTSMKSIELVNVPIGISEDRLLGAINLESLITTGEVSFKPGILAKANNQILYIDEVNLIADNIIDNILDVTASGVNIIEREDVSVKHPSNYILIGTMNPEEGQLRPQILDRFALSVPISTIKDSLQRVEIIHNALAFSNQPDEFSSIYCKKDSKLVSNITKARDRIKSVKIPGEIPLTIALTMIDLNVDGQRPDIVTIKAALAYAALKNDNKLDLSHLETVMPIVLNHRTRNGGMDAPPNTDEIRTTVQDSYKTAKKQQHTSSGQHLQALIDTILKSALASVQNTELEGKKKELEN